MNHKSNFNRVLSALLVMVFLIVSQPRATQAEMITTEAFILKQLQTTPRERLSILLQRKEILKKLEEYGVSPIEAQLRLASLSDSEVDQVNKKMEQLPAGADIGEAILGTALFVFVVLLITDLLCLTKVFRFTRCAGT